jgi:hypothetical protein
VTIFKEDMMIWRYANESGNIDSYLFHVTSLINRWSDPNLDLDTFLASPSSLFDNELDFQVALYLLHDGLLPRNAQKILSLAVVSGRIDLQNRSIQNEMLKVTKHKKVGRPSSNIEYTRSLEVVRFIELGLSNTEAYKRVASKYYVAPVTIRRSFESIVKRSKLLIEQGLISIEHGGK